MKIVKFLLTYLGLAIHFWGYGEETFGLGYEPDDWPSPPRNVSRLKLASTMKPASPLPVKYDSREYGLVTPVKNQGKYGTCWTFSALSSLEASILKAGYPLPDLSEHNLANLHGWDSSPIAGGNDTKASAYLLRWSGAIPEAADPYPKSGNTLSQFGTSVQRVPSYHVQNVVMVPARESFTDNDALKKAVMDYGVLSAHFFMSSDARYRNRSNGAYYGNFTNTTNHAVSLIGWDDNYSKENFNTRPPGDGAWLIKNSYGTSTDDAGYLHISYYDTSFAFNPTAAFIVATDEEEYTGVYGYDTLGRCSTRGNGNNGCLFFGASVFTAIGEEDLLAVGFYVMTEETEYQISVYTNCNNTSPISGTCVLDDQTGVSDFAGFKTVHLDRLIRLQPGTRFSIVVGCRCPTYGYPIAYEWAKSGASRATAKPGQTYFGQNKTSFQDFTSIKDRASASFCCKAYVRSVVLPKSRDSKVSPGEDLSVYLDWLESNHEDWWWQSAFSGGALCNLLGVNGWPLWGSCLAGLHPNRKDSDFKVMISLINGTPHVSWSPNLGSSRRYVISGCSNVLENAWHSPTNSFDRFFKVKVSMP